MLYKDSLILSFFLDDQDSQETAAAAQLQVSIDQALRQQQMGILEDARYNAKGGFQEWTLLGQDARAMLALIQPIIAGADFLVGPRATLIIRQAGTTRVLVQHFDL